MARAKKEKPIDLSIAGNFFDHKLDNRIGAFHDTYVFMEPWPLTHEMQWSPERQARFFDTCFGDTTGCEYAEKAHLLYERAMQLRASTDLRARLAEKRHSMFEPMHSLVKCVRIYGFGSMHDTRFHKNLPLRNNMLLRMNTYSFYPLPASLPSDPLYNGTWVDPLTGLNPAENCLWARNPANLGADDKRVIERLHAWTESALVRKQALNETLRYLRIAVACSGSTEALFRSLPGLRQIMTLFYSEGEVNVWAKPKRGATFNALLMRGRFPLWTSEWTTVHRPLLLALAAASQSKPSERPEKMAIVSHIPYSQS